MLLQWTFLLNFYFIVLGPGTSTGPNIAGSVNILTPTAPLAEAAANVKPKPNYGKVCTAY